MTRSKFRKSFRTFLLLFLSIVVVGIGWSWYRGRTDQLWDRVQKAHAEGRHEAAAISLKSLLRKSPNHAPAHRFLADVLLDRAKRENGNASFGNFKPAYDELSIACKLEPRNRNFAEDMMQAEFERSSFTEAGHIAKELLERDTDNNRARQILAEIALKKDDFPTARTYLTPISREEILKNISLIAVKIAVLEKQENNKELQDLYEGCLKNSLKTNDRLSYRKRSQLNRIVHSAAVTASDAEKAQARLQTALTYFEKYSKTGNIGDAALRTVNLVRVLYDRFPKHEMFSTENFEKTFLRIDRSIAQAIADQKVKSWFYRNAADLMTVLNKSDRAVEIAQRGIENLSKPQWKNRFDEEISKLHLLLATRYVSLGKYRSARPHLELLLKDARYAAIGHRLTGIVSKRESRYSEAFAHFEAARKELKDSLSLRLDMAETCIALKKWNQALPYLQSLHLDRGSLNAQEKIWAEKNLGDGFHVHLQEALCYLSLGQFDTMKKKFEVLRGSRFEPQIAMLEAYSLLKQGKRNDAIASLESARKRHIQNHRIVRLLVKMLDSANRKADADRVTDEFEKQYSDNLFALSFACLRSLENNNIEKAERQLENLTKKFPESTVVWYLKSREALNRKDLKEAALWSEKLANHPGTETLGTALSAMMELKNRNLENAALLLDENSSQSESGMIDLLQSEVQFQQKNYEEALDSLTSAMRYKRWRKNSSVAIFRSLATVLRECDSRDVMKRIDALIAQYPGESLLYMTKTDLYLRQADYSSALKTLDRLQQRHPKSIMLPIFKARLFETVKQYKQALREVNRALEIDANSIPARLLGAQICLKSDRFDAAREYLTKNVSNKQNPAFQLMLASIETRQGNEKQAIDRLEKLIEKNPRASAAYFLLANSLREKPDKWEPILRKGLKAQPDRWFLNRQLFTLLEKTDRQDELQKAVAELDSKKPTFITSIRIADFYFRIEKIEQSQKWIDVATRRAKSPRQQSRLFAFQADIAIRENRKDRGELEKLIDARKYLEKAIELDSRNRKAAERLIALLVDDFRENENAFRIASSSIEEFGLKRISKNTARFMLNYYIEKYPAKSREFLNRLIEKRSHEDDWMYAKVERAIVENRIEIALAEVKVIAEKRRWKPEPWLAIARLHEARNEDAKSIDALFTAVKLQPQHIPSRFMLIDLCQKSGMHRQVVLHTKAILSNHPEMWHLYDKQLVAFRKLGFNDKAERIADNLKRKLDEAIRRNPKDLAAHRAFVKLHLGRNDFSAALAAVQFGRKQIPESNSLLHDEVRILLRLKRTEEGLSLVKHAFAKADDTDCLELARIFLERQMFANSYKWSKKGYAFKNGKSQNKFRELLGEICFHRGMASGERKWFQEAAGYFRELIARNPNDWHAVNNLCWILSDRLNGLSEALTLAEDFRRKHTVRELDIEFIDTLASIYRKILAFERNKDFLEEAIRLHPRHAGIRFELAMSYIELGKSTEGVRLMSNAMSLGLDANRQQIARRYLAVPVKTEE